MKKNSKTNVFSTVEAAWHFIDRNKRTGALDYVELRPLSLTSKEEMALSSIKSVMKGESLTDSEVASKAITVARLNGLMGKGDVHRHVGVLAKDGFVTNAAILAVGFNLTKDDILSCIKQARK